MFYDCFYQWTASSAFPAREARLATRLTTAVASVTTQPVARSLMMASVSSSPGKVTAMSTPDLRAMMRVWEELLTGEAEEVEEDEAEEESEVVEV